MEFPVIQNSSNSCVSASTSKRKIRGKHRNPATLLLRSSDSPEDWDEPIVYNWSPREEDFQRKRQQWLQGMQEREDPMGDDPEAAQGVEIFTDNEDGGSPAPSIDLLDQMDWESQAGAKTVLSSRLTRQ